MSGDRAPGRLVAILGPSGAGKDTLIDAACRRRPDLVRAQRVITRHADAGGEDFVSVSDTEFARREAAGDFLFDWQAHGLRYGIPATVMADVEQGKTVLFNGSRAALPAFRAVAPDLGILLVTARAEILSHRLAQRGREDREDIARRLTRASYDIQAGVTVWPVDNSGSVAQGTARFLAALDEISAQVGPALSSSRDIARVAHARKPERKT